MSHLTKSLLNKPSPFRTPFEFPTAKPTTSTSQPLSPPDTENEFIGGFMAPHAAKASTSTLPQSSLGVELESTTSTIPPRVGVVRALQRTESPTPSRKGSSMAYVNAGIHDSRDKRAPPRTKWLVVVIPPAGLAQEHGALGQTLAHGPPARLSQGILMPLFPTMYAQLTAIAREFNFPSVKGICLYLHMVDNGFTFTPRVSDESWQLLWSHLFESSSPITTLPIGGRLEFDIDHRYARWWDAWMARREIVELPPGVSPSRTSHFRGESKTESKTEEVEEEDTQSVQAPRVVRRTPKKLSLVDRVETHSSRSSRIASFRGNIPLSSPRLAESRSFERSLAESDVGNSTIQDAPITEVSTVKPLTPIPQADEPQSAKIDLENRVKSWRASASLVPTPLAATGQTSLEPANLPNTLPVIEIDDDATSELNLDDFTWSVTSAGPPSDASRSPLGWTPVQSPHMDRRAEGSVALTPTTASSFGPQSYDVPWTPLSNASRFPSPDLAQRMVDSAPPTPTTASSWGPASEYGPSRVGTSRAPSVDLATRDMGSQPPTPTTASSWGPASECGSRVGTSRAPSVDLATREMGSQPPTPTTASSLGPASWPASAMSVTFPHTPDVAARGGWSTGTSPAEPVFRWRQTEQPLSFPYHTAGEGRPWPGVWPYAANTAGYPHLDIYPSVISVAQPSPMPSQAGVPDESDATPAAGARTTPGGVEEGRPWQGVWPYTTTTTTTTTADAPQSQPWEGVWPHASAGAAAAEGQPWNGVWPYTNNAAVVEGQPWNDVWPYANASAPGAINVRDDAAHEGLPVAETTRDVLPSEEPSTEQEPTSDVSRMAFPYYNAHESAPWRGAWPYTSASPAIEEVVGSNGTDWVVPVPSRVVYPVFNIYPATYPSFDIYPAVVATVPVRARSPVKSMRVEGARPYTSAGLAVEEVVGPNGTNWVVPVPSHVVYPVFNIYPAAYPSFDIYPAVVATVPVRARSPVKSMRVEANGVPIRSDGRPKPPTSPHPVSMKRSARGPKRALPPPPVPLIDQAFLTQASPTQEDAGHQARSRKTHADLHIQVFPDSAVSSPSSWADVQASFKLRSPGVSPHKTHAQLHDEVFPSGTALTPTSWAAAQASFRDRASPTAVRTQRKNHTDLHTEVFPTSVVSTPSSWAATQAFVKAQVSPRSPGLRINVPRKMHEQLHDEVFSTGVVATPSSWASVQATFKSRSPVASSMADQQPALTASPHKTHEELHTEVFPTGMVWTPASWATVQSSLQRQHAALPKLDIPTLEACSPKMHQQLHDEVFPSGLATSPTAWASTQAAFKLRIPTTLDAPRSAKSDAPSIPENNISNAAQSATAGTLVTAPSDMPTHVPSEQPSDRPGSIATPELTSMPVALDPDVILAAPQATIPRRRSLREHPFPVNPIHPASDATEASVVTVGRRVSLGRARSGTVSARPPALRPVSSVDSPATASPSRRQLPTIPDSPGAPISSPGNRPLPQRPNGLPMHPAEHHRIPSLTLTTNVPAQGTALSPLAGATDIESPVVTRGVSRARSLASRPLPDPTVVHRSSASAGHPRTLGRENGIAERAKAFNGSAGRPSPQILTTLNEFPMPPLPPLPKELASPRTDEFKVSPTTRVVNKLDPTRMAAFKP